ncbi:MAG: glutamate synthase large subunit [Candidatus Omnitrophica bacterium CG07_land_8_20_14_0_80_42_15]|uniref:Glutamate synthase [NADPH] large chain n=1 Tax=Candidatus Aquitaenariimonas noxiae TaxID=1974741 RepID=A0A2J0L102_9BACT|nr:MAG: glutamate synthase large subunit [Candidatus Omnitrophica bacterium CG07_land_8_20_14_0_80_42_15]
MTMHNRFPHKQGLYDPQFEHDSCGVGFVCDIKGRRSHEIIRQGLKVLNRLSHRGAVGADPNTGDGAGILIQIPHKFLSEECRRAGVSLPDPGTYGTGLIFLPTDKQELNFCIGIFDKIVEEEGQKILGWRDVPVNDSIIGTTAKETKPVIRQIFIAQGKNAKDALSFERKLYVIRRQIEKTIRASELKQKLFFYITNLSSRTLSYKGLLTPSQLGDFFIDLKNENIESAISLVHSRYSTNTFPTWDLAQPFRFLAHNGEINTLRGNINWVSARERLIASELFGTDIEKAKPVIVEGGSDSATIDNFFELLVLSGRPLEHAMMMLIPEAWEHNKFMNKELKEFYKYHACFMEPWDGPAAVAFTDGRCIGAVLDRNGLRPARYIVTKNDFVVMASEVGVLDIEPSSIKVSGRLEPGKIFFIDTELGSIVHDSEIKKSVSARCPYEEWNAENMVDLGKLTSSSVKSQKSEDIVSYLKAFGYSREDVKVIIKPMAEDGKEPVGSMGNDTPHAFLSKKPQALYNYFKQLFAQVTNPPIDPIREKLVMSLESFIGPEKNILEETPKHSHKLMVKNPILTDDELERIRDISINGFKTKTIYTFFDAASGREGFVRALERISFEAEYAIEKGYSFIILSDRGSGKDNIALPSLLATSAVHQHLVRKTIRSQVAIIIESAEPREVHHFALLFGYGADCVNPYLAYEGIEYLITQKEIRLELKSALKNYNKALTDGILKILSKMGISTLRSYRGAQIFEALGLDNEFIDKYFTGTVSRIGGVGLSGIADEYISRHMSAYYERDIDSPYLSSGGIYQWKKDGESHLWNPETIHALQDATLENSYDRYREFANIINDQSANPTTLRSLFKFSSEKTKAIPINEVEPIENIMRRFATGAMSFGSISRLAHETIAIAMNRIGGKSNTGEGGEDPNRFITLPNGDSRRSAIKQVASGRFGVTTNYLVNADEIQIKIAQGAKPGEGGQLPGHKVSEIIARTRYTTPGVTLISPPPHHDIYSIEDLAQLIFDLKNVNPTARISVKLVSEIGVGTVAAGVAKGRADMILISGGDGGTGASPLSSIRYAGLPWELGLSETHQTLVLNNLRSRTRIQTDGQMRTGRDVAIAALLGAEEYGFCTAVLIVMGCVMLRHCHLNNCSVGVATQDDILQKHFSGRPEYIVNYFRFVAQELREIMASLGVRTIDEMIGRTDLLHVNKNLIPLKVKEIDYSKILYKPDLPESVGRYCKSKQESGLDTVLDKELIKLCKDAFEKNKPVKLSLEINNTNRATGTMLSGEVTRKCGDGILLEDTIMCKFRGIAGQSFGAFLAKGITLELEGMANDYVGKGISGGKIIIYQDRTAQYKPDENIIIGNTTFYGAISGEAYICGVAGERFCVRNSGLHAVVEGVGDHGCEYMTGGRIIILGKTGRNFAAGMSGGIAYVYDEDGTFKDKCNMDMIKLEGMKEGDKDVIYHLLHNHFKYTKSEKAKKITGNMREELKKFVKVIPIEYKRILEGIKVEEKLDLVEASDG